MKKELWTLRKLNISDEEVEQLLLAPVSIYHHRFLTIIGLVLFPFFLFIMVKNHLLITFNASTILVSLFIIILGFNFIFSLKQMVTKTPALIISHESITFEGVTILWKNIDTIQFTGGMSSSPLLKIIDKRQHAHEMYLKDLSLMPKEIHTLICKYYSIADML